MSVTWVTSVREATIVGYEDDTDVNGIVHLVFDNLTLTPPIEIVKEMGHDAGLHKHFDIGSKYSVRLEFTLLESGEEI